MRFGTLNIQRAGAMKVNMLADLMDDHTRPLDFLAVQELILCIGLRCWRRGQASRSSSVPTVLPAPVLNS